MSHSDLRRSRRGSVVTLAPVVPLTLTIISLEELLTQGLKILF